MYFSHFQYQVELPQRSGVCAVATQGSSQYDTDYVTKYEIQTSLDRENWETYKENGTNKVNLMTKKLAAALFHQPMFILYMNLADEA